jgi:aminopeptidase-like protein
MQAFEILEKDRTFINLCPKGEPQLGKRGLYSGYGSGEDALRRNMAVLWVLNLSDGNHSLLDIAERADLPFDLIASAASALESHGLLSAHAAEAARQPPTGE